MSESILDQALAAADAVHQKMGRPPIWLVEREIVVDCDHCKLPNVYGYDELPYATNPFKPKPEVEPPRKTFAVQCGWCEEFFDVTIVYPI